MHRSPPRFGPLLALLLACMLPTALAGATCKYVDAEGRVTFANVPVKDARKVMCFEPVPNATPAPKRGAPTASAPQRKPATDFAGNVRVDPDTQKRRDLDRRRILEDEIADERRLLDEAMRTAGTPAGDVSPQAQERRKALQDTISRHEKNIQAIRREIGSIR